MDYHSLPRKDLQLLCKKYGIPANKTNLFMADALAKKRIPLSDVNVNKDADNDLFLLTPLKVSAIRGKPDDGNVALFNNTPFLRRGTKKKEGDRPKSSDGTEGQVEVSAGGSCTGTRLFQEGGCDPIHETPTEAGADFLQKSSTKDLSVSLQREESKSCKSAKGTTASLKQKPEEKVAVQLRSAAGPRHQTETRRGGKSHTLANVTKAANETCTSSVAATRALHQPDGSTTGTCESLSSLVHSLKTESTEPVVKETKSGKRRKSTYRTWEQEDGDSTSSGTSAIRLLSPSESSFPSAGQEDIQPENVVSAGKETGSVSDAHMAQVFLGQDSNIEGSQQEESELGGQHTSPKERYIVKVTFADEVSIMGQGSGGVEKVKLEESMVRRSAIASTTNGGCAVKSKLDSKPATNLPFVFRATKQEETKPKRSKNAARETSELKGRSESKASIARAPKQDETKAKRTASSEGKEAVVVVKVKPEAKSTAVPVPSSYPNPSKRPRLASGSKLANDHEDIADKVRSSPTESIIEVAHSFEFPRTYSEEFMVLDLPEWAKEFKRKREDTLPSTSSVVAHTPDGSTNEDKAASPAPGFSPLKRLEDTVGKLLDKLKGFCWKAEVDALVPETEAAHKVEDAAEEADQILEEHTLNQQGRQTD